MTRRVSATYDPRRVLVWQAHSEAVADAMVARGGPGGPAWSLERHTRFRLSLPLVLERSGWGTAPGRERVLGLWLDRELFDSLLEQAVHGVFERAVYGSIRSWRLATRWTQVTVDWQAEVDLHGRATGDETPRLGVRQGALRRFTDGGVVAVEDWTDAVRGHEVEVPERRDYPVDPVVLSRLVGEG